MKNWLVLPCSLGLMAGVYIVAGMLCLLLPLIVLEGMDPQTTPLKFRFRDALSEPWIDSDDSWKKERRW